MTTKSILLLCLGSVMIQTPAKAAMLVAVLLMSSCLHDYENTPAQQRLYASRSAQKTDTLLAGFQSCTECLDLFVRSGKIHYPADLKRLLSNTNTRDIKVCGNFPKDLINMTSWNYDPDLVFHITGKVVAVDSNNALGTVPIFYVASWESFPVADSTAETRPTQASME